jgi:hypothetical protein
MRTFPASVLMVAISTLALAQDVATETEESPADPARDAVESPLAADSKKAETKAFTPPPGFKTKKSGKHVLYCKKDRTTGTRFATEKCYDEAQMRDYLVTLEEQKRDIDRIRSTCASAAVCSSQ